MPQITVDGQSLSVDGRRVWLVSGTIHYTRIPRDLWRSRLAAARDAGLNCIEAPVPWSKHEPRPGVFDFDKNNDLAAFVKAVGDMGMFCALRAGPHIGDDYDLGGLPAWLLPSAGARLRSSAPEFLTACSRYTAALCAQIKDLQSSNPRKRGGPIVMLLSEYRWFCGDEAEGAAYLGNLDRFFRENAITVPIVGANNLFHSIEGQIDAWCGSEGLHAIMRQLRSVQPEKPAFVAALDIAAGTANSDPSRRIATVLAAGAQFNLSPFAAGLPEFSGDHASAPIDHAGRASAGLSSLRRVCSFASQFARVFANLEGAYQPVTQSLEFESTNSANGIRVIESVGTQGRIIWIFSDAAAESTSIALTLEHGETLPVPIGAQPVAWALLDTHLIDRATLDYCNLCAFALVGATFVCFGPAGATGLLSINGSAFEVTVPVASAKTPSIELHEGVTIVVCNVRMIDATFVTATSVLFGASGVTPDGAPVAHPDYARVVCIDQTGARTNITADASASSGKAGKLERPSAIEWAAATTDEYVNGTSDRFALIDGPAEMQSLGAPSSYGWLRLKLKRSSAGAVSCGFFESADRLHLFQSGAPKAIVGIGAGASGDTTALSFKKGENTLTLLADNLGRRLDAPGGDRSERKGLYGHIYRVAPFKAGTAKLEAGAPLRPLAIRSPLMGVESTDITDATRLVWKFQHRRKSPLILTIEPCAALLVVILNDQPIEIAHEGARLRLVLTEAMLSKGNNTLQVAMLGDMRAQASVLKKAVQIHEGVENLTEKAEWAFARWEPPTKARYSTTAQPKGDLPTWWRGAFKVSHTDARLFLDTSGLTKGRLYLNGHDLGAYHLAQSKGKKNQNAAASKLHYLPEPWLRIGEANDLVIFEEHGSSPSACRLTYED